jgi:hypothetical protein
LYSGYGEKNPLAQRNQGSGDRKGKPEHKVAVSGSIQVYRPPEIEQRHSTERKEDETTHKAERKEDRGRETTRMWLEGLTLLAVLVYAGITFWQGTLTRWIAVSADHARDDSRIQFIRDQRPYVWTAGMVPFPIKTGDQIRANIYFVNYGKTPAIKEKSSGKILLITRIETTEEATKEFIDPFFDTFDENKVAGGSEIILPPGIPQDPKKSPAFVTVRSDFIVKNGADIISKTDGSFAIVGVVTYYDSAGTHYRSDFCMLHTANGNVAWCIRHNDIH